MSVTSCNFINSMCKEDANQYASYTAIWQIITDDKTEGPALVRQHPELPQVGDGYSTPYGDEDDSARCIGRDFGLPEDKDTTKVWRVTLQYTNNPGLLPSRDGEGGDPPQLPWNEPPKINLYSVKDKEAFLFDLDGNIIASSAGEPFDPVQERDRTKYMLRINQNQLFVDPYFYSLYTDAINTDPFFGCDPYTVKVETPGAIDRLWFGATPYYNVTWEFSIDPAGFRLRLFDYGMYRMVGTGASAKREIIRDLHGDPLTSPALLDGAGGVLAVGSPPVAIKPQPITEPTRDWFRRYRERPFWGLGLPQFI